LAGTSPCERRRRAARSGRRDLLGYTVTSSAREVIQTSGAVVPGRLDPQDAREDELTHLRVLETGREILPGDKLFPTERTSRRLRDFGAATRT